MQAKKKNCPDAAEAVEKTDAGPDPDNWHKSLRNAGKLGSGRALQGVCSLGVTAVAARALGAEGLGSLVLLHTGCLGMAQLLRAENWALIVSFGPAALRDKAGARFRELLRFSFTLDLLSALLAAAAFVISFQVIAESRGFSDSIRHYGFAYGPVAIMVMNLTGSATGVLRLFDRFNWLAVQSAVEPVLRLFGSLVVWYAGGGLGAFLVVWMLAIVVGRACLLLPAQRVLRHKGYGGSLRFSTASLIRAQPGLWRFTLGTQLDSSLRLGYRTLPILLIGALVGPAGAGLFRVARQFSDVIGKLQSKLIFPALLPEISRLSEQGGVGLSARVAWRVVGATAGIAGLMFGLLLWFGHGLIAWVAGPDFAPAYPLMLWFAGASWLETVGIAPRVLLMAKGKVGRISYASGAGVALGLLVLLLGLPWFGLVTAGAAALVSTIITLGVLFMGLWAPHRRESGRTG